MTSAEIQGLLDQAVALLRQTTVGYAGHGVKWRKDQSTKWWQGLDKLAQARAAITQAALTVLLDEAVALLKKTTVGYAGHSLEWQQNQTTSWWQALDRIARVRAALGGVTPPPPPPNTPVNSVRPSLSGTARVGQTLTVANGTWSPTPTSYSYAWHRCDAAGTNCALSPTSSGAATYLLTEGDAGRTIVPQVAPNGLWSASANSLPSAVVLASASPPPDPEPVPTAPLPYWTDGFQNRNHLAFMRPSPLYGGRAAACDCHRICPGGTPDVNDKLDSYIPDNGGYAYRVVLRPECKSLNASCLNACELVLARLTFDLGKTEFLGHRVRVMAPYTPQVDFCVISQFGYPQVKYNGLGLNLLGETLSLYCNLGYSEKGSVAYNNPQGYSPRGGNVPVALGQWHDYVWEVTYSNVYGVNAGSPIPGKLKLHHRLVGGAWSVIFDSTLTHPNGVPTRQWGYGLGNDTAMLVDVRGIDLTNGQPRKIADKLGAYRGRANATNLTVDHRKFCTAASFASAERYLNAPG